MRDAAERAPDDPVAQFALGWALDSKGDLVEARMRYEKALALDPAFVEPMVRLAMLAVRRGDWDAARGLAQGALDLRADDYGALTALANVAVAQGELADAEGFVRKLLALKPPTPLDAAFTSGLLGDLRHAQRRHAEAFEAYTAANRAKFALYAGRYDRPGQTVTDYCRWMSANLRDAPVPRAGSGDPRDGAAGHAFLIGFPRSGTTLLENALAAHPDIATLEERDLLEEGMRTFLSSPAALERLATLSDDEIAQWRKTYWSGVRAHGVRLDGKIFIDKYPLTLMKLPLVAKLFPQAHIIFALRDPRDVVLSCFRRSFGMNASMFEFLDLERAAAFYDAAMTLAETGRLRLRPFWHPVRHERLVADFAGETRALCGFLGTGWSAQMERFAEHARSRPIRTPSANQVVRGLNRDGLAQWRHYAAELRPVMSTLDKWARYWGYEP